MNAKYLLLCWMILAGSSAWAGPPSRSAFDPYDPEKTRPMIAREEREQLGLSPRTWTGVVHPDVYATLDRLNKAVANLKDRVAKKKEGRDLGAIQAIRTLGGIRFEGTVYVEVHLRHEPLGRADSAENKAAIKQVQRRVLASLMAAEFHAPYLFETHAGFTGYATKEALDKLAKNADVTGVCLDDKALPDRPPLLFKDDLPPMKPGDKAANQPGVAEGKVEAEVYRAFDLTDRVDVIVVLKRDSLPSLTDKPSEMWARQELRDQAEKQLQDRALSTVSADDFWLWTRRAIVSGYVTKEGLQKLWKHPDVRGIGLDERVAPASLP